MELEEVDLYFSELGSADFQPECSFFVAFYYYQLAAHTYCESSIVFAHFQTVKQAFALLI